MKTSHIFWPSFFAFLIFFSQGFWSHQNAKLEIEKNKPKLLIDSIFSLPDGPLNLPKPKEEFDPHGPNSADNYKKSLHFK